MQRRWVCFVIGLLAVSFLAVSCNSEKKESKESSVEAPATSKPAAKAEAPLPLKGKAKEVLTGGGFSYILIENGAQQLWVAVPETDVAVGEEVTVAEGQRMQNFASKTLGRTFDELLVAGELVGKAPKQMAGPHGMPSGAAPHGAAAGGNSFEQAMQDEMASTTGQDVDPASLTLGSSKAIVPFAELKIKKAAGNNSYTVGELFDKADALNGKKVVVRGQVMKMSPNIMGRNWLHIQDGTGNPIKNTHDLVVTSSETAKKGDIVTITGTLSAKKDFGAGYSYAVIVENASVSH